MTLAYFRQIKVSMKHYNIFSWNKIFCA